MPSYVTTHAPFPRKFSKKTFSNNLKKNSRLLAHLFVCHGVGRVPLAAVETILHPEVSHNLDCFPNSERGAHGCKRNERLHVTVRAKEGHWSSNLRVTAAPGRRCSLKRYSAELRNIEQRIAFLTTVVLRSREPLRAARRFSDTNLYYIMGTKRTRQELRKVATENGQRKMELVRGGMLHTSPCRSMGRIVVSRSQRRKAAGQLKLGVAPGLMSACHSRCNCLRGIVKYCTPRLVFERSIAFE